MKNKSVLLSIAILSGSLLAQTGAFAAAASMLIDESNFQVPTNGVLYEEWNTLGAQATGFDPTSLTITINNETLTQLGVVNIHGAWVSPNPFADGQVQTYRYNFWDALVNGVPTGISDTVVLTLSGQQANPNNMTIDLRFRSDNLGGNVLTPVPGGVDIIENGLFQSLNANLPTQLTELSVSIRSDIPEPSSLALLAVGALSLLSYASRKRRQAA
jgi:hypothetical protein